VTELEKALACSEWFCALIRRRLTFVSMDPTPSIDWLFMVEQSRLAHRLSGDSELLDVSASGGSPIPN
jgi:hypothetical protein